PQLFSWPLEYYQNVLRMTLDLVCIERCGQLPPLFAKFVHHVVKFDFVNLSAREEPRRAYFDGLVFPVHASIPFFCNRSEKISFAGMPMPKSNAASPSA